MNRRTLAALAAVLALAPLTAHAQLGGGTPIGFTAPPPYFTQIRDVAGAKYTTGSADGWAKSTARFQSPAMLAADGRGGVFVVDAGNDEIRYVHNRFVSTWRKLPAGMGAQIGGIAYRKCSDEVWYTNRLTHQVGAISETSESALGGASVVTGYVDGSLWQSRWNAPTAMAADSAGNVYVSDTGNKAVRKIDCQGSQVSTIYTDPWLAPRALAFDEPRGILYAAISTEIDAIDVATHTKAYFAGYGVPSTAMIDGDATTARFAGPEALAVDGAGNVFVADVLATPVISGVYTFSAKLRQITPSGSVGRGGTTVGTYPTTVQTLNPVGERVLVGTGILAHWEYTDMGFERPVGLVFSGPDLYVSDALRATVRRLE